MLIAAYIGMVMQLTVHSSAVAMCVIYLREVKALRAGSMLVAGLAMMLVRRLVSTVNHWEHIDPHDAVDAWIAVTLSVCMVIGWWMLYSQAVSRRLLMHEEIAKAQGSVNT